MISEMIITTKRGKPKTTVNLEKITIRGIMIDLEMITTTGNIKMIN